jgi:hypothetical protein
MDDKNQNQAGSAAMPPLSELHQPQHAKILDQTLGELLQSNPQAQGVVMNAMHISPDQLQQMLSQTGNNAMMQMKIGDLFKNGIVQKAMVQSGQATPEQLQQVNEIANAQQGTPQPSQKTSLLQKVKGLFGL